ncbi:unnamed protein product, partial [Rotaria sp. Silwood2]
NFLLLQEKSSFKKKSSVRIVGINKANRFISDKQRRDTSISGDKRPLSNNPNKQSFISSPVGQFGAIAVLAVVMYYGYNMMSRNEKDLKQNEHYKKATADYQAVNATNTDVKP